MTRWEPKSKSSDNLCLFAVHKLARNHRFWKAKSFYNWWIPILYMMHQSVWNDAPYNICCYFYEFFCLVPSNWHLLLKKATFQFTEYIYGNRLKTHFTCIRCKICWVMTVIRSMLDNLFLIVCIFCIKQLLEM